MLDISRIIAGLVISTAIGWLAYRRRSLSRSGWLGAIITGTLTFGFGGWTWGLTLIAFFLSSSVLSHYKQQRKQQLAGEKFEKGGQRDLAQTLANGGAGAALALLYGVSGEPAWVLAMFAGVMATVTADTWATELGVLNRSKPRLVTTLQPVAPGTSGGITWAGTLAGVGGALFIGVCLMLFYRGEYGVWAGWLVLAAVVGGPGGSLIDSLLGATLQAMYGGSDGNSTERAIGRDGAPNQHTRGWQWLNNDAVNLLSSLGGAIFALTAYIFVH